MSPILVRPVREQLEHDRVIRLLQGKCRRKFEVGMNPGAEQNMSVVNGAAPLYPDLILQSLQRGHRLQAVVEVETGESVNYLEALAQWAHFAKLRAAFHLYVPSHMVEVARRLCEDNHIQVHEFWSYHFFGEEVRFTLVHRNKDLAFPAGRAATRVTTNTIRPVPVAETPRRTASTAPDKAPVGRARKATSAKRVSRPEKSAGVRKAATGKPPARTQKRK